MSTKKTPNESFQSFWERFTKEMAEIDKEAKKERKELDKKMKQEREELDKKIKKEREELDKKIKKERAEREKKSEELEAERKAAETHLRKVMAELAESQKKTGERIDKMRGHFDDQWGKLMEALVEGDLIKLLNKRNIKVHDTLQNYKVNAREKQHEYDLLAVDGEEAVVTEVKTTLRLKDVEYFVSKMHFFKAASTPYKHHKIYGAIAYLKANDSANIYAQKQGLWVIRATGSSASIINAADFKARVF